MIDAKKIELLRECSAALDSILAEREQFLAVLRAVEWSGAYVSASGQRSRACHLCAGLRDDGFGHNPDCRLAALLTVRI